MRCLKKQFVIVASELTKVNADVLSLVSSRIIVYAIGAHHGLFDAVDENMGKMVSKNMIA